MRDIYLEEGVGSSRMEGQTDELIRAAPNDTGAVESEKPVSFRKVRRPQAARPKVEEAEEDPNEEVVIATVKKDKKRLNSFAVGTWTSQPKTFFSHMVLFMFVLLQTVKSATAEEGLKFVEYESDRILQVRSH